MRTIREIAFDVKKAWPKVNYAAVPYLEAMQSLTTRESNYGCDDARSVVAYFLANAQSFRGEEAKKLKIELKQVVGIK